MRIGKSGEIFSKYTRGVSPEFRRGGVPGAGTIKLSFMDRKQKMSRKNSGYSLVTIVSLAS